MSTTMANYPGLSEDDSNSTFCEKCGCRITIGKCAHGVTPPQSKFSIVTGLLKGDVVEVMTAEESKQMFGITFNENWRYFLKQNNHVFTVHEVIGYGFECSLFTSAGHIVIEGKYIKRLIGRRMTPADEAKWLSRKY